MFETMVYTKGGKTYNPTKHELKRIFIKFLKNYLVEQKRVLSLHRQLQKVVALQLTKD